MYVYIIHTCLTKMYEPIKQHSNDRKRRGGEEMTLRNRMKILLL